MFMTSLRQITKDQSTKAKETYVYVIFCFITQWQKLEKIECFSSKLPECAECGDEDHEFFFNVLKSLREITHFPWTGPHRLLLFKRRICLQTQLGESYSFTRRPAGRKVKLAGAEVSLEVSQEPEWSSFQPNMLSHAWDPELGLLRHPRASSIHCAAYTPPPPSAL